MQLCRRILQFGIVVPSAGTSLCCVCLAQLCRSCKTWSRGARFCTLFQRISSFSLCSEISDAQELQDVDAGRAFGASLDLKAVGQPLGPDTLVPGVAVYRCAATC